MEKVLSFLEEREEKSASFFWVERTLFFLLKKKKLFSFFSVRNLYLPFPQWEELDFSFWRKEERRKQRHRRVFFKGEGVQTFKIQIDKQENGKRKGKKKVFLFQTGLKGEGTTEKFCNIELNIVSEFSQCVFLLIY